VDADTAILPADVLSKQALEGQAEDLALEDTLYSLDKALQGNSLTPELYIKQVCPLPLPLPAQAKQVPCIWRIFLSLSPSLTLLREAEAYSSYEACAAKKYSAENLHRKLSGKYESKGCR
jgi:hypothetical protein